MEKLITLNNSQEISVSRLISATGFGVFMSVIDSSVVNISLFKIANWFNVSIDSAQWIILVYLLSLSALMLVAGDLGDRFGNKFIFQLGMFVFTIGSLLSAFSLTLEMLILFRFLQACGASLIMANGVAIITKFTSKGSRGVAIGWNSLIVSSGLVVGPVIGGILTEYFGWSSIFLINVPIGILGIILVQIQIPKIPKNKNMKKLDITGAILFSFFIISFIISLTLLKGISNSDNSLQILLFFVLTAIFSVLFFIWSKKSSFPILNLELMRNKTFLFSILTSVLVFTLIQVIIFQLPFFLQQILLLSPLDVSFIIFGIPIMMALTGPWAGRLSDKIEPKYISTIGIFGIGIVFLILAILTSASMNIQLVFILMLFLGFTIGLFASPNSNAIMSSCPKENAGIAGALLALARNFGFSTGIALSTAILILFQNFYSNQNGGEMVDVINYVPAFQAMLFITFLIVLLPILTSYFRGTNYYK